MQSKEMILAKRTVQLIESLNTSIEIAEDWDMLKDLRARTKAFSEYAKQAGRSQEVLNDIAELKLRAERKAGQMLSSMSHLGRGGDRRSSDAQELDRLEDIGVTKRQSSLWQQMAEIPEEDFQRYCDEQRQSGKEITQAGLLRIKVKSEHSPREHFGFKCPYCGISSQRCQKTYPVRAVSRKREQLCLHCKRKFHTIEVVYDPRNPPRYTPVRLDPEMAGAS